MNTISTTSPIQRLIGLQACAKVVHREGQDLEDTAKLAIQLYDLLLANAMKPGVLPKRDALKYRDPMTVEQRGRIGKLVQENKLDRARFEGWMGTFFPEVRDGGLDGLTNAHAAYILGKPEGCLKAFREFAGVASMDGGAQGGQGGAIPENRA